MAVLLEGHPLADVVRLLAERGWEGTATELLAEVNRRTPEDVKRRREWYAQPKQLERRFPADHSSLTEGRRPVIRRRLKQVRLIRIRREHRTGDGARKDWLAGVIPVISVTGPAHIRPGDRGDAGDAAKPDLSDWDWGDAEERNS